MNRKFPSSAEEGWLRHKKNAAKPPLIGADGVVLVKKQAVVEPTTPAAPIKGAFGASY